MKICHGQYQRIPADPICQDHSLSLMVKSGDLRESETEPYEESALKSGRIKSGFTSVSISRSHLLVNFIDREFQVTHCIPGNKNIIDLTFK